MSPQSCGVAMELLTKCTQEQSERVSSTSRSVCLIRPHFILLLLLQFIAKPSETYIYLYCTVTVWRLWGAPLFYKVDAWSLFTPGCANFSQQNEEKNIHFFLNKSCCWFFLKETFQCKPCKQNPFYLHNTEGKMNPSLKIKMRMTKTICCCFAWCHQECMRNLVVHTLVCLYLLYHVKQQGYFCSSANLKRFSTAVPGDTLDYVNERACHFLALIWAKIHHKAW